MDGITMRAATPAEQKYTYTQSTQIAAQTGCIGHLRADMDTDGTGFYSSWDDQRGDLKTEEFKTEFDRLINGLRSGEGGSVLSDRRTLAKFCYQHPEAKIKGTDNSFAFRYDSEKYSYMLRLCPDKGEYNLYCYAYTRDWFDKHLKNAERGIRFINSHYKDLFRIPDGDMVRIDLNDGTSVTETARYIDEYHVEVGRNLYHICEFAERMEQNGNTYIPIRSSLPERCLSTLLETGEIIEITCGEKGYRPILNTLGRTVDEINASLGVSKAQEQAMKAGSMFGFEVPLADPANYDENGKLKKEKGKERRDVR